MFLETSSGRKGDKSYITSPKLKPGMRSVKFYYHMHGKTMGILSLEAKKGNRWYTIWHKQGQQQVFLFIDPTFVASNSSSHHDQQWEPVVPTAVAV